METVDRYLEARIEQEHSTISFQDKETLVEDYPISIEWPTAATVAGWGPVVDCRQRVFARLGLAEDTCLAVGVDRFDYTKGILERLNAVERLLEKHPEWVGRFVFVQVAAPTRSSLEEYRSFQDRIERLTHRINERFGRPGYQPVHLLAQHHEPEQVNELFRAANICVVTSLHDGMNLVSKEFVAARDDEQGVLLLSRFAGAARELTEALIVNPYHVEETADALYQAATMPSAEQRERMASLRSTVHEFNVYRWAGHMLSDAARWRLRARVEAGCGASSAPTCPRCPNCAALLPTVHEASFQPRRRGRPGGRAAVPTPAGLRFRWHAGAHRAAAGRRPRLAGGGRAAQPAHALAAGGHRHRAAGGRCARAPGLRAQLHRGQPRRRGWADPAVAQALSEALESARELLAQREPVLRAAGVSVEDKQQSIALHYRLARDRERARQVIDEVLQGVGPTLTVFGGKLVVNLTPANAPDKAHAVRSLVARSGAGGALFAGDDLNDEPVFAAAAPHWLTIKIGREPAQTRAAFFLENPAEMALLLERILSLVPKLLGR
jgi:hypothetical protein